MSGDSGQRPALRIRAYAPEDREAVRDVCWRTAFDGAVETVYRDSLSWADMYTSYYTDYEPEHALVVVTPDDRLVGYLLACADIRRWHSELRIAWRHMFTRFLWARPATARFWWRAGWDVVRDLGDAAPELDFQRYPAHLHCNLLPEARARGIGLALFSRAHEMLIARGAAGVYGETLASNVAVHSLLTKLGWQKFGPEYPVPGLRTPEGARVLGQRVVCDLRPAR